ncbi:sulfotransferase [Rhizobium sp. L1K21]|uniref:sulfotransferase family protein n=1 Tax=Rhizobium sp. L1K21 TaxID=2954933 RepID=UPI002092BD1E|nr:sulfotransferase [Rhizobium sp. L1K21]
MKPKPVFIVGFPRSGTTLVQSILWANTNVFTLPETMYFMRARPRSRLKRLLFRQKSLARSHWNGFLKSINRMDLADAANSALENGGYEAPLVHTMEALCEEYDASYWIEKTPAHLRHIDEIERVIPSAQFIHVIRNGADAVRSFMLATRGRRAQWEKYRFFKSLPAKDFSIEYAVQRWNDDIARSLEYVGLENHFFVNYDNLTSNPQVETERLCHFLGLPFQEAMLTPEKFSGSLITSNEPWKAKNSSPISKAVSKQLTSKEEQYMLSNLATLPDVFK